MLRRTLLLVWIGAGVSFAQHVVMAPKPVTLSDGWAMQDAAKVNDSGTRVSTTAFDASGWYRATVPGTALTTLVDNGIYPEPNYGENVRPEVIPESLSKTSWWYRDVVMVPANYAGRHVWLNFDGINYASAVWVNGTRIGETRGAFMRGRFDISAQVKPGTKAVIAVLVMPQPHPGEPHEHTLRAGVGKNGGITAIDGPTFLSTIGWDWLPAVPDRDTGIWQKVWLSATGGVEVRDPLITTDLPLPKIDVADVTVKATVKNLTDAAQSGMLQGGFEGVRFEKKVELAPHEVRVVTFDAASDAALHLHNPKLWWPNGYGPQNLYALKLQFVEGARVSDESNVTFGVRKITYSVGDSDNLTISVNGRRVFVRGGDWGLDEALKRIPPERIEAEFRLHQLANMNMIRNWVGQSTSDVFYEMADKYGMLLWDEFFQPNPGDGPNPDDLKTYIANVREKILRYRNHPSIAVWCARNEGPPPPEIDVELRKLMAELEPTRLYQPSSTDGRGVRSGGPYSWRTPESFYKVDTPFKTEIGSMSVPTLESVHAMMPWKDWESINDDWAEHDFAKGAQQGRPYRDDMTARYGAPKNLADFVRKAQMMNYDAFRAMYEGREARMFAPATGVITWMSKPAHPSFTWQLYDYSLEPMSSLFAVRSAGETVHVALNEATGDVFVVNNTASVFHGSTTTSVYALDGHELSHRSDAVNAKADGATVVRAISIPTNVNGAYIVRLALHDVAGKVVSENTYWRGVKANDLTALDTMPRVALEAHATRSAHGDDVTVRVILKNPTQHIALMTHVQLRRADGERVLPQFADANYVTLLPGETRTIEIDAATRDFEDHLPLVAVDGWNVEVAPSASAGVTVQTNVEAQPEHWPVTGLPVATEGLR